MCLYYYFLFTPMIPPNIPHIIPDMIIIIDCVVSEKLLFAILDNKYILNKYIPPIRAPLKSPFFFIFMFPIELPMNMLIAVSTIITGAINDSLILLYVNTIENINKKNKVNIIEIITPFVIFKNFFNIFSSILISFLSNPQV